VRDGEAIYTTDDGTIIRKEDAVQTWNQNTGEWSDSRYIITQRDAIQCVGSCLIDPKGYRIVRYNEGMTVIFPS
jgi:hypothetical protein